jgi:hypothetical protein
MASGSPNSRTIPTSSISSMTWSGLTSIYPIMPSCSRSTRRAKSRRSIAPSRVCPSRGRTATMTHDHKRNGTTALFSALGVLEGKVIGRCMRKHSSRVHPFPQPDRGSSACQKGTSPSTIIRPTRTRKSANGSIAIRASPFHFAPTSSSWPNAVEGFFAKLFKRRLKCGLPVDPQLQAAIDRCLDETNNDPKPFHAPQTQPKSSPASNEAPIVRFDPLDVSSKAGIMLHQADPNCWCRA